MNIAELLQRLSMGANPDDAIATAYRSPSENAILDPNAMASANLMGPEPRQAPPPQAPPGLPPQAALPPIPQSTAPVGARTPVTYPAPPSEVPKAYQSPPDLANMYMQMLQKNQNAAALDSGLSLIAAGFSKYPENRAALLASAGRSGAGTTMTSQDLINLQKAGMEQKNMLLRQSLLGGLAKQYNMSPQQIQYLEASGKLDEVLKAYSTESGTVVEHPDKTKSIMNLRTGKKIVDISGEPPKDVQIVETAQGPIPVDKQEVALGVPIGGVKPEEGTWVETPQGKELRSSRTGLPMGPAAGAIPAEWKDKLDSINRDRAASGQPPMTTEKFIELTKSGVNVNIGPKGEPFPDPPKDYAYLRNPDNTIKVDADGKPMTYPMPGSKAELDLAEKKKELTEAEKKEAKNKVQAQFTSSNVGRAVDKVLGEVDKPGVAGVGSKIARNTMGWIGGLPQDVADANLKTIESNVAFETLRQMRQASPTGGALGNISDFENKMLGSVIGSLATFQDRAGLKDSLIRIKAAMELLANDDFNKDPAKFQEALDKRTAEMHKEHSANKPAAPTMRELRKGEVRRVE